MANLYFSEGRSWYSWQCSDVSSFLSFDVFIRGKRFILFGAFFNIGLIYI